MDEEARRLRKLSNVLQNILYDVRSSEEMLRSAGNVFEAETAAMRRLENRIKRESDITYNMADSLEKSRRLYEKTEQQLAKTAEIVTAHRSELITYLGTGYVKPLDFCLVYDLHQPNRRNVLRRLWMDEWMRPYRYRVIRKCVLFPRLPRIKHVFIMRVIPDKRANKRMADIINMLLK